MTGVVRSQGELREFLRKWDKASKASRERILFDFVKKSRNMTGPELDREYGNGASLLLTRICAYLRTRAQARESVGMAMQAICVFVAAASGHRFLSEFLDVRGLEMVLAVIKDDEMTEMDRMKALQVLAAIANAGYTYKQMICQPPYDGIGVVCQFIPAAQSETAHELARSVLIGLARGQNKPQELQEMLLPRISSEKPLVQRTAAQVLRQLLNPPTSEGSKGIEPNPGLVDAVKRMFTSVHVHVLFEAQELAMNALTHEVTREEMLKMVIELLRPVGYKFKRPVSTPQDSELYKGRSAAVDAYFSTLAPAECLVQQAAAARLVSSFLKSRESQRVAFQTQTIEKWMEMDLVLGLLTAMANTEYSESKKHGMEALQVICKKSQAAEEVLTKYTSSDFLTNFKRDPSGAAANLDMDALNSMLLKNGFENLTVSTTAQRTASSNVKFIQEEIQEGDENEEIEDVDQPQPKDDVGAEKEDSEEQPAPEVDGAVKQETQDEKEA